MTQRRTCIRHVLPAMALIVSIPIAFPVLAQPVHVMNDAPARPPRTLELEELWRVGGEDDEEFLFGMIIDSLTDVDGNVYLLDNQLCQVEVFAPDGRHVRTLSGQGEGPGEVQVPQNLVMLADDLLGIVELFPGRIVTLSLDGVPGETVMFGGGDGPQTGFVAALGAVNRGGSLLVAGQRSLPSDRGQARTQYLARLDAAGNELVRYREASMTLDFADPRFVERELLPPFFMASAVGPEGRILTLRSRAEYAIEVYAPDGELERVIERRYEPRKRDRRDMRRMNALVDAWVQGFPGEMPRDLDPHEPAVSDLFVTDDGTIWVRHSRSGEGLPDGILLSFDTFDPTGNYIQEVHVRAEGDAANDGVIFLGDDRVLVVRGYVLARWASRGAQNANFGEEEESGPMEVICCRMMP